ncbi:MAG: DNA polymerase I, partial [candidate division KSB1 bacterium]|nr:DNA polymerase I [candidate division KSB1 bacterium]
MLTEKTTSKLFLIDGSALAYRSHFAFLNNPLTNSKGETTSAVFGFTRSLLKILDEEKPNYIAVVFDTPQPTFRHKAYADYKATRQKMPEDMASQLPRIKQVIEAFRIPIIEVPGYEADDVMGTLARKAEGENLLTYLVTGDKDFMQLVTSRVKIYNPKRAGDEVEIVDEKKVKEKLGVPPQQVRDVLGLMGDTSDNVPGVPGIGPKTASQLIQEFSSLENVLENLDKVTKQKLRESLKQHADSARLSKKLVTIDTAAPIELDFEQLKLGHPDNQRLVELFKELEFNTLLGRFTTQDMKTGAHYEMVTTTKALEELITHLKQAGSFTL